MSERIRKFLIINAGLLTVASGMYFFLIPSDLAVGGTTGLAIIIGHFFPTVPIGVFLGLMDMFLLVLAFLIIGKEFGGYTVYASAALAAFLITFELALPMAQPFTDDLFINLIFGVLITGAGMAIVFNQNASTGGTDIVAKIINKYTHIEIGKSLLLADFFVTLFAGVVFGPKLGMYALLGVMINSVIIDKMIAGFAIKMNVIIISSKYELINRFIHEEINRGTTIYFGQGGFSGEEKNIINTIVSRKEYIRIRDFIRKHDNQAFLSVSYATEVEGEGFTK